MTATPEELTAAEASLAEKQTELDRRELALERDRQILGAAGAVGAMRPDRMPVLLRPFVSARRVDDGRGEGGRVELRYFTKQGQPRLRDDGSEVWTAREIVQDFVETGGEDLLSSQSPTFKAIHERDTRRALIAEGKALPETTEELLSLPPDLRVQAGMKMSDDQWAILLGDLSEDAEDFI